MQGGQQRPELQGRPVATSPQRSLFGSSSSRNSLLAWLGCPPRFAGPSGARAIARTSPHVGRRPCGGASRQCVGSSRARCQPRKAIASSRGASKAVAPRRSGHPPAPSPRSPRVTADPPRRRADWPAVPPPPSHRAAWRGHVGYIGARIGVRRVHDIADLGAQRPQIRALHHLLREGFKPRAAQHEAGRDAVGRAALRRIGVGRCGSMSRCCWPSRPATPNGPRAPCATISRWPPSSACG